MTHASGEGGQAVREGPLAAFTRPLAVAGGFLMLAVAATVTVNVLLRWLFNTAVSGDIELAQIGTAVAVFAFLPLCQSRRGNIVVDSFTAGLPPRVRNGLDALWDIVYVAMALIIAWRLGVGAWDTIRSNTVSMMLGLPTGWAIAACSAMAVFLALVAIATALRVLRSGR
ncbi:MAG: TRAP transporter small permease [Pseudorhodoplanes sp.]|nr:TRAP transporter small permease [Pseudorhodoplanes sp.]